MLEFVLGVLAGIMISILFAMVYYQINLYGKKQLKLAYKEGYNLGQKEAYYSAKKFEEELHIGRSD